MYPAFNEQKIKQFIQQMPKAEIHVHLEGSISPETVFTIAERNKLMHKLSTETIEGLEQGFKFNNFPTFCRIYVDITRMLMHGEDFELITYQNGADMAAQNIRYRELTITPYVYVFFRGLRIEEILEGLDSGRRKAEKDFGVKIRWVFDIAREVNFPIYGLPLYNPIPTNKTLKYALMGRDIGVVALGLGGDEVHRPPEPFGRAFVKAKQHGLLSVPHAGETVGPKSIWGAIKKLKADRIGHGVRAAEDPVLMQYLVEHKIPMEVCPTSNIFIGVYESLQQHPLHKLDEAGIPLTINSDDPALFNSNLSNEYLILAREFGYSPADIIRFARNAYVYSGLEQVEKDRLLTKFDDWAGTVM